MSDYFNPIPTTVPAGTRALSSHVNAVANSISAGFDKLPTENQLKLGLTRYAVDTGVADAYIITLPYVPVLTDGFSFTWKAVNANTGAATINVNSTGVKSIENPDSSALIAGTFGANAIIICAYESVNDRYILVSQNPAQAAAAAASAAAASTSEGNASTSAGNASTSETNAAASAAAAEASYDSFDDRYLGPKASDPALDNDGNALVNGALYWNTTDNPQRMYGYDGNLVSWDPVFVAGDATTLGGFGPTQFLRSDAPNNYSGTGAGAQVFHTGTGRVAIFESQGALAGTDIGVYVEGNAITSGTLMEVRPNNATFTGIGLHVNDLDSASAGVALQVSSGTSNNAFEIVKSGSAGRALYAADAETTLAVASEVASVYANNSLRTGTVLAVTQDHASSSAVALNVQQEGTSSAIRGVYTGSSSGSAIEGENSGTTGYAGTFVNLSANASTVVRIVNDAATANGIALDVTHNGSGTGVNITHPGNRLAGNYALDIVGNNGTTAVAVARIKQDDEFGAAPVLLLEQDGGAGTVLDIVTTGNGSGKLINMVNNSSTPVITVDIDIANASNTSPAISLSKSAGGTGARLLEAIQASAAPAIYAEATITTAQAASFFRDVASPVVPMIEMINENATGTDGSNALLQMRQDAAQRVINIEANGDAPAVNIFRNLSGVTTAMLYLDETNITGSNNILHVQHGNDGNGVYVDAERAGGTAIRAYSNTASRTQPLVEIINDNATGSGVALTIQQDQSAPHIDLTGANGEGIKFPATNNVSTDVNTLDDYEEGTYDVAFTPAGGTINMNTSFDKANYTKIGRVVHVQGQITVSSVSAPTGDVTGNLPFTAAADTENEANMGTCFFGVNWTGTLVTGYPNEGAHRLAISAGGSTFQLRCADASVIGDHFTTNTNIYLSFSYVTDL